MLKFIYSCIVALFLYVSPAYAAKVAVIGGGAAGVNTAFLTEEAHDVTIYEAGTSVGGHVKTDLVKVAGQTAVIDAGAEYFNKISYPNLVKLLEYLLIATTAFTLTVNFFHLNKKQNLVMPPIHDHTIEFNSFRPSNLLKLIQLKWVIYRGRSILDSKNYSVTLESFLENLILFRGFKDNFLYPFLAAQWGVSVLDVKNISAYQGLKYLINGNDANNEWLEATNGLHSYIEALTSKLSNTNIQTNAAVQSVIKQDHQYKVTLENGGYELFDHVVFAVNPKIAGKLLENSKGTEALSDTFKKVHTFPTKIALAKAEGENMRFLPKENPQVINIRYDGQNSALAMYKTWKTKDDLPAVIKTWVTNDIRADDDKSGPLANDVSIHEFEHVYMDVKYYEAYKAARAEEGKNGLWFPGIHEDDSHEGTLNAVINVARQLAPESRRLGIFA
tara:strand:- start:214234 stop:215568 length:1335 start_codon:yes stop_codon:yes gene_type:complete